MDTKIKSTVRTWMSKESFRILLCVLLLLLILVFGYVSSPLTSVFNQEAPVLEDLASSSTAQGLLVSDVRPLYSRSIALAKEDELLARHGIIKDSEFHQHRNRLYKAADRSSSLYTLVPFVADGLTMQVPYSAGWGAPYFQLTPYDRVGNEIQFGELNPCPGSCLEPGAAIIHDKIILHPAGSLASLVKEYPEDTCKEHTLNEHVSGIYCAGRTHIEDASFFVEGSRYTYEFRACLAMDRDARDQWCPEFYKSIRVE